MPLSVVHLADLLEEAAHQLEEEEDLARAPVVAVAEAATADAVPEEEHTAQTVAAAAAGSVVDATEDHPSTVAAHHRDSTGRVQVETSRGYKVTALAAAAALEVEDGRTEQVQVDPGLGQELAKEVVRTGWVWAGVAVEGVMELLAAMTSTEKEACVADLSLKVVARDVPRPLVSQGAYGGLVEVGRD